MVKGRRKKVRFIQKMPKTAQFSPRGNPGRPEEIELKIDEFEAIKLADYQGYDQSQGAVSMGVSRPSFGRILRMARKIVADALVNGKIIRIRTANVQVGVRQSNLPKRKDLQDGQSIEELVRKKIMRMGPEVVKERSLEQGL